MKGKKTFYSFIKLLNLAEYKIKIPNWGYFLEKTIGYRKNSALQNLLDLNFLLIVLIYDHINSDKGMLHKWLLTAWFCHQRRIDKMSKLWEKKFVFISSLINWDTHYWDFIQISSCVVLLWDLLIGPLSKPLFRRIIS